ncbi:MAG TPA: PTS sugar transporter subunit IIA [Kiritimatiellia bacterium]|nr:PTS sugar transporter subunit IIA [Kiritimatiellia bacterium]
MPHTRLTLSEAARYLHLSEDDIRLLVKKREIPHESAGSRVSFVKGEIDAWASRRLLGFDGGHLADYHRKSSAKMHDISKTSTIVAELLKPSFIRPALNSRTKASVVRDMVDLADSTGLLNDKHQLLESINERERLCSTALSGGMAILHPQHHVPYLSEDSFVVLGRTVQPIPFGSPDGRTTDMFFLVCCQDERIHLHVLARICMLCYHTPLLMNLREMDAANQMYDALVSQEIDVIRGLV